MKLVVLTPDRLVISRDVESVELPGEMGVLTILPNHQKLCVSLVDGVMKFEVKGESHCYIISSGLTLIDEKSCRVLVRSVAKQG